MSTLSVVIPVRNGAEFLTRCLSSLRESKTAASEYLVVDDGSSDNSREIAQTWGATVLSMREKTGPAAARNLAAAQAKGDLLLFVDADVCLHPDTIARILAEFASDPTVDAVIGSYDDQPASPGFVSQYKNLQHHFVHQHGRPEAATFWSGCGAIRAEVFRSIGGFNEDYSRPCVEDIELGYRLRAAKRRIVLNPEIQITHLKRYSLLTMWYSDIFDRALPWTRLILRSHNLPNDLNLALAQRVSAALVMLATGLAPVCLATGITPALAAIPLAGAILLNWDFCRFLARKRGWLFAVRSIPLQLAYYLYSTGAFAIAVMQHLLVRPSTHLNQAPASRAESGEAIKSRRIA